MAGHGIALKFCINKLKTSIPKFLLKKKPKQKGIMQILRWRKGVAKLFQLETGGRIGTIDSIVSYTSLIAIRTEAEGSKDL